MLSDPEVTRELLAVFGAEPEEILEAEAVEELPPGEPEG
jgi:hypothetical protein